METGFFHLHSTIAYLVLLGLLLSVIFAIANRPINPLTRKIAKITMILTHIQILAGLALYFVWLTGFQTLAGGSEFMSDPVLRLKAMEHPLMGIIAVILVTIGHSKSKKASDALASKPIIIFYLIALILILSRLPYGNWF
ncbi:MAG: hypothetical protein M9887_04870 [Chitinophagales bacterium]|nr:hypothetical protein [Chitinophagales bacterium]